jgi:DNA-binding transcriptional regulator YiaG
MIAVEIRNARNEMGLTQQQLADLLLLGRDGRRTVQRWEVANVGAPGPAVVAVRLLLAAHRRRVKRRKPRLTVT